jgi:hypothetical protein
MIRYVDGKPVALTAEEIAEWEAQQAAASAQAAATAAKAELAQLDAQFQPRWFEDLAAGGAMPARYVAWRARRVELRQILAGA